MKHGVYSKQYSFAKRADKIGYYLVFMTYIGCTSSKSMVSTWIVSYLLVYTWHTPLHYPHAVNAGCVLAGVAPVMCPMSGSCTHWLMCWVVVLQPTLSHSVTTVYPTKIISPQTNVATCPSKSQIYSCHRIQLLMSQHWRRQTYERMLTLSSKTMTQGGQRVDWMTSCFLQMYHIWDTTCISPGQIRKVKILCAFTVHAFNYITQYLLESYIPLNSKFVRDANAQHRHYILELLDEKYSHWNYHYIKPSNSQIKLDFRYICALYKSPEIMQCLSCQSKLHIFNDINIYIYIYSKTIWLGNGYSCCYYFLHGVTFCPTTLCGYMWDWIHLFFKYNSRYLFAFQLIIWIFHITLSIALGLTGPVKSWGRDKMEVWTIIHCVGLGHEMRWMSLYILMDVLLKKALSNSFWRVKILQFIFKFHWNFLPFKDKPSLIQIIV